VGDLLGPAEPAHRLAGDEQLARLVLAADESAYMTGASIIPDGGFTL